MSSDSIVHEDVLSHVKTYTKKDRLERLRNWYNNWYSKDLVFFGVTFLFAIACIPLTFWALMNRNFLLAIFLTILSSIHWLTMRRYLDNEDGLFVCLLLPLLPWFDFLCSLILKNIG